MVSATGVATLFLVLHLVQANFTRVSRENVLLSRRRRYLNFPMDSNFVVTLSHIKFLLQVQPRGWAILLEIDVPFALPADTRQLKGTKTKRHVADRENFREQAKNAFTGIGLDGEACIRKITCQLLQYKTAKGKSLVKDLLYASFIYPEDDSDFESYRCNDSFAECSLPILEYFMGNISLAWIDD